MGCCLPLLKVLEDLTKLDFLASADFFVLGHDVMDVATRFLDVPLLFLLFLLRRRRGVNHVTSLVLQEKLLFLIEDAL